MAMFVILFTAVVILFTIWTWKRQRHFKKLSEAGIPTPPPHWLYGHLPEVNYREGREDPTAKKDEWLKRYGKVVGYYNGMKPNILVADLELLKKILIKDFNKFTNRAYTKPNSNMLISMEDQKWKDTRKLMTPVFSSAKMKTMMPLMKECVEAFVARFDHLAETKEEFNAHFEFQNLTLDVIDRCAMALDLNCIKNPMNPIIGRIRTFFNTPLPRLFELILTFPAVGDLLRPMNLFSAFEDLQNFVFDRIRKVIAKRKSDPQNHVRQDALQMLLEATDPNSATKTKLTESEVVENAFLFVIAGYETTSNALSYVIHLLSVHPEIQETILQEVQDACGEKIPTYDDLSKLPYTEAVINESMRLYPPITSFVTRKASADITYGDFKIPKGMSIEVPVWSIHHDEEIYHESDLFKPERFLPENKQTLHPLAFIPFGAGPRNCIGARFAMVESKLTLATIVSKYIINPTPRTKDPLPTITQRAITNPRNGVWVTLSKRKQALAQ